MGPKSLFLLGVVLAHGALGAVWVQQEPSKARPTSTSCVNTAAPLPYFEPPLEILARMEPSRPEDRLHP